MANPLGSAPSIILGVGLGAAASTAIEPVVESARQTAWKNNRVRILTPELYAQLVAQGAISLDAGRIQSHLEGLTDDKFDALVHMALRAPPHSEAQDLRRRNKITHEQLLHSFAKDQIEEQYWAGLADLVDERLSPQEIALGIIRSILKDPGYMPVQLDTSGGVVPRYPVSDIDPVAEAATSGIDSDRLRVMVGEIGLPPSVQQLASMLFRGIVERPDYYRGVLEGDARPEWADFWLEQAREILTANQYAELQLRGFLTPEERLAETAKHGMSKADSDLLYNLLGRSIPVHQIVTGEARGGTFNGPTDTIPQAILSSLQRGNLRPEFYNLAHANRYSYPSAFFFRLLITTGAITAAEAEQAFLEIGWSPKWAKLIADALAGQASTAAKAPWTAKAANQLWTATHRSYLNGEIDETLARTSFQAIGIPAGEQADVIALWDAEIQITTKPLTPANIKKAYKANDLTVDEATARLVEQHWSAADANLYLTT